MATRTLVPVTVFITTTGTGTYTVPPDFYSLISVEAIGGGGNGTSGGGGNNQGGGGGAYAKSTTMSLTAGQTCYYQVGTTATSSWFNPTTNAAPTANLSSGTTGVLAAGGTSAVSGTAGAGGTVANSTGDLRYAGGTGGGGTGGSGGGGAAGPLGAGGAGGAGGSNGGGGGGGSNGGNTGNAGGGAGGGGGNGGNGYGNGSTLTGGGAGGNNAAGTSGTAGTGGGGGGAGATNSTGGNGATGSFWTQTSDSATAGSGGGGGAAPSGSGSISGSGGLYGGGGAGFPTGASGGTGAQGIVVISYNSSRWTKLITSGQGSFTLPTNPYQLVAAEAIGGGASADSNLGGGGGGAYAKSTSIAGLSPGQPVFYTVGAQSTSTTTRNPSWINTTANAAPTLTSQGCLADGGLKPEPTSDSGSGGLVANCIGDVKYAGGNGGAETGGGVGAGGGGAAGPGGAGGNGGNSSVANLGGGGGGGASLTGPGYNGSAGASGVGGAGGNGGNNTGGGAGGNPGSNGTAGTGGGGGGTNTGNSNAVAGNGGTGVVIWTDTETGATAGPGGGGGGDNSTPNAGGFAGNYGGGGGGKCSNGGAGGLIALTITLDERIRSTSNVIGTQNTGFKVFDSLSQTTQDLGQRYVSKNYLLDVYPNIASSTGTRTAPGLWAWGENANGTLGDRTAVSKSSPVQIGSLATWKQVVSRQNNVSFAHALKNDGTLWTWGSNQLGRGDTVATAYSSPVQLGTLTTWKNIYAGGNSATGGILTTGQAYAWGLNTNGMLGVGSTTNVSTPVQIGTLTTWKSMALGKTATAFLRNDGTLWVSGANTNGQLGGGATVQVSTPVQIGAMTNWKQVVAGDTQFFAVKTDGTLWAWGDNTTSTASVSLIGTLGLGDTVNRSSPTQIGLLTTWKQVSCARSVGLVFAIKTDGTLWAWGNNRSDQISYTSGVGIYSSPVQIGSLTNWKQISVSDGYYNNNNSNFPGSHLIAAIKTDGTLWTWGTQSYGGVSGPGAGNVTGGLGLGDTIDRISPTQVGSLTTWKQVAASYAKMFAIQDGYI